MKRGQKKGDDDLLELNRLWAPLRPYLVRHIADVYGREEGRVLDIGPFSGLAFELARSGLGRSFLMAVFPPGIVDALREEARGLGVEGKVGIEASDFALSGVPREAFDLAIFRGAFFFPSFFQPDLTAVYRSLAPGGVAVLGGGFGRYTPEEVIERVRKRSTELNIALGRVRVSEADLLAGLESACLPAKAEIVTEGGLWLVLRK